MNFLRIFLAKIGKVFLVIFATFRRALCCFRRRRLSDSLPFTAEVSRSHFPSEGAIMHSWNTWDDEERGPSSVAIGNSHPPSSRGFGRLNRHESECESEPDVDFFQDMVPEIRRPAKIIIRKHDDIRYVPNDSFSGRLAVDPQLASGIGELGHWEENEGSWEDSMDIASMDDDSIHREAKLLDRERRAAENLRRKQEKDAIRMSGKRDHLATKIS